MNPTAAAAAAAAVAAKGHDIHESAGLNENEEEEEEDEEDAVNSVVIHSDKKAGKIPAKKLSHDLFRATPVERLFSRNTKNPTEMFDDDSVEFPFPLHGKGNPWDAPSPPSHPAHPAHHPELLTEAAHDDAAEDRAPTPAPYLGLSSQVPEPAPKTSPPKPADPRKDTLSHFNYTPEAKDRLGNLVADLREKQGEMHRFVQGEQMSTTSVEQGMAAQQQQTAHPTPV